MLVVGKNETKGKARTKSKESKERRLVQENELNADTYMTAV
tara:strand:- start:502 stop:624 length:123 start_codon:yes stop_codon:yes gene_type:complete